MDNKNVLNSMIIDTYSFEKVHFVYQVSFPEFTTNSAYDREFQTEYFAPPGRDEPLFNIVVNKKSYKNENDEDIFCVKYNLKSSKDVKMKTSSWLVTNSGEQWNKEDSPYYNFPVVESRNEYLYKEKLPIILDEKNGLLPEGILTFCWEITLELSTISEKTTFVCPPKILDGTKVIIDNLKQLLQSGEFSDFEFTIGERKFPVHKAILHSRSPYFQALFSQDFKEKTTKSVSIMDIDADLFAELLDYLYTSKLPKFTDVDKTTEIFIFADKYQLEQLKTICEYELVTNIRADSMFTLLKLADTYNASILKSKTIEFILSRASSKDILQSLFECRVFGGKEFAAMLNVMHDLLKDK